MSFSVICNGCGRTLLVADDYPRNKMRCPECGVMCELPVDRPRTAPASRSPAPSNEHPVSPPPPSTPPPATAIQEGPTPQGPTGQPVPKPVRARKGILTCPHCGERSRLPKGTKPYEAKCPVCGLLPPPPPPVTPRQTSLPPKPPTPPELPTADDDDWSANPYDVTGGPLRHCPSCQRDLPPGASLCTGCGYDLQTGQKVEKVYNRVVRHWHTGWTHRRRVIGFIVGQCLSVLGLIGAIVNDQVTTFLGSWVVFTLLLAFVLGTYDALDLTRSKRGQATLTKTWLIGFLYTQKTAIPLNEYEGVTTEIANKGDLWDWMVFVILLCVGCLPALFWWYFVLYKDSYEVCLTREHGARALTLLRAWKRDKVREIEQAVRDAAGYL